MCRYSRGDGRSSFVTWLSGGRVVGLYISFFWDLVGITEQL
jgi:hypothetical protein